MRAQREAETGWDARSWPGSRRLAAARKLASSNQPPVGLAKRKLSTRPRKQPPSREAAVAPEFLRREILRKIPHASYTPIVSRPSIVSCLQRVLIIPRPILCLRRIQCWSNVYVWGKCSINTFTVTTEREYVGRYIGVLIMKHRNTNLIFSINMIEIRLYCDRQRVKMKKYECRLLQRIYLSVVAFKNDFDCKLRKGGNPCTGAQ